MPEEIQDVVKRISEGRYNLTDLQAIVEAVKAKQVTVAPGDQAVGIGGGAENATIVTGTSITGNHFEIHLHGNQAERVFQIAQRGEKQAAQEESLGIIDINYIRGINTSLQSLRKLSETEQFSQAQNEQFSSLKQRIKSLEQELKNVHRKSQMLFEDFIQHVEKKLEDLYLERQKQLDVIVIKTDNLKEPLNEEIQQIERYIKEAKRLEKSLSNYQKVADCLNENRSYFAARAAEEALKIHSGLRDAATQEQIADFCFSIEQFLEQISHCLRLGRSTILDFPGIPLEFDKNVYVYEAAFQFLKEMIPPHLPTEGIKQFRKYVDYLISRLCYY